MKAKRGGRRGEEGDGAGNDRTETEGWRGETFIRLSVCVSAGILLFLFLGGQNVLTRIVGDEEIHQSATSTTGLGLGLRVTIRFRMGLG